MPTLSFQNMLDPHVTPLTESHIHTEFKTLKVFLFGKWWFALFKVEKNGRKYLPVGTFG